MSNTQANFELSSIQIFDFLQLKVLDRNFASQIGHNLACADPAMPAYVGIFDTA